MRYCYEIDDLPQTRFITAIENNLTKAFSVEGWAVKLLDYPNHSFFIHRPLRLDNVWVFTEASTGLSVSSYVKGKHVLIRNAIEIMARVKIDEAIAKNADRVTLIAEAYAEAKEAGR